MGRISLIQNDEVLMEVLTKDKEFFIPCEDKKDAHSKLVSLINARRRLSLEQQRGLRVQKLQDNNSIWGVKVSPAAKRVIYEIVDGKQIPWNPEENILSEESKRIVDLMLADGISESEIISTLSHEKVELVVSAIEKAKSKCGGV
jgi:hypothetical protein